mmetsp:Transcript_16452/g.51532  ORF Transcript_16452/g.51532 Transcript_16452/m.51532 type:complete len:127 (+) Transcript_16452:75-455(+)
MARRGLGLLALVWAAAAFMPTPSLRTNVLPVRRVDQAAARSCVDMKFRVCDLTGKRRNAKARTVTFSHTRNHKVQQVNLQKRKLWWEEGNCYVRMRISTKALKTIAKYGLQKAAKKYDVDLASYRI